MGFSRHWVNKTWRRWRVRRAGRRTPAYMAKGMEYQRQAQRHVFQQFWVLLGCLALILAGSAGAVGGVASAFTPVKDGEAAPHLELVLGWWPAGSEPLGVLLSSEAVVLALVLVTAFARGRDETMPPADVVRLRLMGRASGLVALGAALMQGLLGLALIRSRLPRPTVVYSEAVVVGFMVLNVFLVAVVGRRSTAWRDSVHQTEVRLRRARAAIRLWRSEGRPGADLAATGRPRIYWWRSLVVWVPSMCCLVASCTYLALRLPEGRRMQGWVTAGALYGGMAAMTVVIVAGSIQLRASMGSRAREGLLSAVAMPVLAEAFMVLFGAAVALAVPVMGCLMLVSRAWTWVWLLVGRREALLTAAGAVLADDIRGYEKQLVFQRERLRLSMSPDVGPGEASGA